MLFKYVNVYVVAKSTRRLGVQGMLTAAVEVIECNTGDTTQMPRDWIISGGLVYMIHLEIREANAWLRCTGRHAQCDPESGQICRRRSSYKAHGQCSTTPHDKGA